MKAIITENDKERIIENVIEILDVSGMIEGFIDIRYYGKNEKKKSEFLKVGEGTEITIR